MAKLTVYRRRQSKEDLLMAALEHARIPDADQAAESLDEVVEHTAELVSPRFRALMARVIGASVDHPTTGGRLQRPLPPAPADRPGRHRPAGHRRRQVPPDTDPAAIQDVLASSIGLALLHGGDITAEQIRNRLHTMLRQMGYHASPD